MNCAEAADLPRPAGRLASRGGEVLADWRRLLPAQWQLEVVVALDFASFRDYEIAAGRCFGYDEDGRGCYYAHDYALVEPRSDDDESFYAALTEAETQRAWRLRDGRWLSFRRRYGEDGAPQRGFFTLTETPPRIPPK